MAFLGRRTPLAPLAISAVTAVAALATSAGPAHAATSLQAATPHLRGHHKVIYPTRSAWQGQVHSKSSSTPSAIAAGSGQLSYGGGVDGIGVTTGTPKVYLVFWGSQWGTASTSGGITSFSGDAKGIAPVLQKMFAGLGTNNETWSGVMTQYCEGVSAGATSCPSSAAHVGYPTGGALAGVWADTGSAAPSNATGHQIGVVAVAAAAHFGNTSAASNRSAQYVVVSPSGTHPDGFNTSGGNFCAWHDYNGDTTLTGGAVSSSYGDIAFTNLPYVTDAGSGCGQNYVNSGSAGTLDGVSMVEGHEYAETVTDQNPAGGWTDSTGYENADKCAWVGTGGTGGAQNVTFATGSFAMQATWSNDASGCQISHPVIGGGGGTGNTVTVTNPGRQSGTVGTAARLQISASDSGGATLSYSATGLPAGLSISSSTGLISGTPTTAGTSSTTVTATDSTGASGSASFSWTITTGSGGGGCTAAGQKLGNPGFETGSASPWTASSGVISSSSSQPTHSGTYDAWLDGYGSSHTDTLSQSITLPSGCTSYALSFYLHIDTAETTTSTAYDKLTVQIVSGSTTTTLATYSNLNKASGYTQRSFNLSGHAGQTVTLKFTGTEDSSLQTSFVVDDAAVNVS